MAIKLFVLFLAFSLFIVPSHCEFLVDSKEAAEARQKWNREREYEVTGGKIAFSHTEEAGTFCENKQPTFKNEFVFHIKSDYLLCGCNFFCLKKKSTCSHSNSSLKK
jgi:hypothetical protein